MKSSAALREPLISGYEGLVRQDNGHQKVSFLVGGVHCAACIQKIESALLNEKDVVHARLNFSTGRLNIEWNGEAQLANKYANDVVALGYRINPYDPDIEKSADEEQNRFLLLCLGVAGFAVGNIMLLSVGLWTTSIETMGFATRELMHWVSALIAIPAVIFSGRPFFRSALDALRAGHTNMDVPISVGLILATSMSLYETMRGSEHAYFDSAVMLMFFLLIGRYLDFRARRNARSAATDLMQTLTGFATVIEGGRSQKMLIRDLRAGMSVSVAAGEKIPVDGVVRSGESSLDTSLITGETMPRPIRAGHEVYGGTLNISAPLIVEVTKAAESSLLADIVRLMEKAEQGQAKYVRLADRVARLYTPVVHTLAALAFATWVILGMNIHDALMIAVTVLIITCPCALGLAVPVVQVLASGRLFKSGILVKSGDALERLANIDLALLDKTGTLTLGKPRLLGEYNKDDLQIAASLAGFSRHPLSQALTQAYDGEPLEIENVREHPGKGMEGVYQGRTVLLGSRSWCGDPQARSHEELELWLNIQGRAPMVFLFEDQLREDARETIQKLKGKGLRTVLLSGDRTSVAEKMGHACSMDEIYGELTPVQKFDYLQARRDEGHKILMVGDGLNDAPVLAGADISMAPGTAIDMAQNAADIIFMGEYLDPVHTAYAVARKVQILVRQNFMISVLYNVIAIPLAFCGYVTPLVAALAMSGSSLLVIANSFKLKGAL